MFAFDPWRSAILLIAGDKAGRWNRWYTEAIPKAEQREWMEQNLAIFEFTLDDEDMAQLGALDQGEAGRAVTSGGLGRSRLGRGGTTGRGR